MRENLLGKLVILTGHTANVAAPTKYGLVVEENKGKIAFSNLNLEDDPRKQEHYAPHQYRVRLIGGPLHDSERLFLREQFNVLEFDEDEKKKKASIVDRLKNLKKKRQK